MKKLVIIILLLVVTSGCYGNIDPIKENAASTWENNGFKIIGYSGYEYGAGLLFTNYGGASVWYVLNRIPDNGITYEGCLRRWGDEYHIYNLQAIDAIKPN